MSGFGRVISELSRCVTRRDRKRYYQISHNNSWCHSYRFEKQTTFIFMSSRMRPFCMLSRIPLRSTLCQWGRPWVSPSSQPFKANSITSCMFDSIGNCRTVFFLLALSLCCLLCSMSATFWDNVEMIFIFPMQDCYQLWSNHVIHYLTEHATCHLSSTDRQPLFVDADQDGVLWLIDREETAELRGWQSLRVWLCFVSWIIVFLCESDEK